MEFDMLMVYVLTHVLYLENQDCEKRSSVKQDNENPDRVIYIGVYSSYEKALLAIEHVKDDLQFKGLTRLVDIFEEGLVDGFQILQEEIDVTSWTDGFSTWNNTKGDWEDD